MPAAAVTGDSVAANGENAAGRRHPMRRDTTILGVVVGPDLGRRGLDFGSRLIGAGEVRIRHGKPLHSHPTRSAPAGRGDRQRTIPGLELPVIAFAKT
ncbi:MAG TPA: hypothetical protein VKB59_21875 [Micromonosporaceae bacterium]|nr:hypothetical protein [Micromonosporaceae bacterium]